MPGSDVPPPPPPELFDSWVRHFKDISTGQTVTWQADSTLTSLGRVRIGSDVCQLYLTNDRGYIGLQLATVQDSSRLDVLMDADTFEVLSECTTFPRFGTIVAVGSARYEFRLGRSGSALVVKAHAC